MRVLSALFRFDFAIYLAARTTGERNNAADDSYIEVGSANWRYDASGTIAGANAGSYGTWTAGGTAGVTVVTAFNVTSRGNIIEVPPGKVFNLAQKDQVFQ